MREKSTDDLSRELMDQPNIDAYLKENQNYFFQKEMTDLLSDLFEKRDISKAALARKAGMSEVYLHQVFSGRRKPSRDRLICLCVGLEANLEETQQLLKQAAYAPLHPKVRRDAFVSYGILHQFVLSEINDKLFAENEKTLF